MDEQEVLKRLRRALQNRGVELSEGEMAQLADSQVHPRLAEKIGLAIKGARTKQSDIIDSLNEFFNEAYGEQQGDA